MITIVEWRASGHRLAYVAAIVAAGHRDGIPIRLVTTSDLIASEEFAVHLASSAVDVRLDERLRAPRVGRALASVVRREQRDGRHCVVPEADQHVWWLLAARLGRRPDRGVAGIVMRPPTFSGMPVATRARAIAKGAGLVAARLARPLGIRLLLLDDAVESETPVWRGALRRCGVMLRDPADLFLHRSPTQPAELAHLSGGPVLAVLGSLDGRKHIGRIVDAWSLGRAPNGARLVLFGKTRGPIGTLPPGATLIDRYATDAELAWVLRRASAVILMYDGGLSSGILNACALAGVRVVAPTDSRLRRVAESHGLAVPASSSAAALALAMALACELPPAAPVERAATRIEFGGAVIRAASGVS